MHPTWSLGLTNNHARQSMNKENLVFTSLKSNEYPYQRLPIKAMQDESHHQEIRKHGPLHLLVSSK